TQFHAVKQLRFLCRALSPEQQQQDQRRRRATENAAPCEMFHLQLCCGIAPHRGVSEDSWKSTALRIFLNWWHAVAAPSTLGGSVTALEASARTEAGLTAPANFEVHVEILVEIAFGPLLGR